MLIVLICLFFYSTATGNPGLILTAETFNISAPLGSSLFWPFKAGLDGPFGNPSSSVDTYNILERELVRPNPGSERPLLYEVSPFNYGLYFDILHFSDSGDYSISYETLSETLSLTVTG